MDPAQVWCFWTRTQWKRTRWKLWPWSFTKFEEQECFGMPTHHHIVGQDPLSNMSVTTVPNISPLLNKRLGQHGMTRAKDFYVPEKMHKFKFSVRCRIFLEKACICLEWVKDCKRETIVPWHEVSLPRVLHNHLIRYTWQSSFVNWSWSPRKAFLHTNTKPWAMVRLKLTYWTFWKPTRNTKLWCIEHAHCPAQRMHYGRNIGWLSAMYMDEGHYKRIYLSKCHKL